MSKPRPGPLFSLPPFEAWRQKHAGHKAGPQFITRVHVFDWWACPCGVRAIVSGDGAIVER